MQKHHGTVFGGTLLVAGTTIGGGMLALPVLTSPGGFIPSILIYLLCWLFMTATGLLFLELSLQMEEGANIVTMAEKTLGKAGKVCAWGLYLFLFYCLTVAYIVGCGDLLTDYFHASFSRSLGPLVFLALFGPFVYAGTKFVGKLNYFLMAGLAFFYFCFVAIGASEVTPAYLIRGDWSLSLLALPIAFTAFAYQGIIPTLVNYLDRNARNVKMSIWFGTGISLITYIVWQWLILGIIPYEGSNGLHQALMEGRNAVHPLRDQLAHPYISLIGQYFAFFALVTSFFGVTLGLLDFLSDGLKVKKTSTGKLFLCALVFIPPLLIAMVYPDIFLQALDYAGGYGCALLLGLLPILMVARLRSQQPSYPVQLRGGKAVLLLMALFVLFELVVEVTT